MRRELGHRGLLEQLVVVQKQDACELKGLRRHWVEFRRWRRRQRPPVAGAYGFRLTFAEPVAGPVVLGFGCHHGLGLYVPEGE